MESLGERVAGEVGCGGELEAGDSVGLVPEVTCSLVMPLMSVVETGLVSDLKLSGSTIESLGWIGVEVVGLDRS